MKLQVTVKELSFGIYFFDAITGVHCSFFTILPNELMLGWKEIEKEWLLPRPGADGNGEEVNGEADNKDRDAPATEE